MQLKFLALCALLTAVDAQSSSSSTPPSSSGASESLAASISASEHAAFVSAIPSSAFAYLSSHGITALYSHWASEFAAGETPGWVSKLPPKVESEFVSYIVGIEKTGSGSSSSAPVSSSSSFSLPAPMGSSSSAILTPVTTTSSPSASSSSTSNNLAAKPTAVVGAGLVGAVGILGLLAL